jgi:hypothetical protein
MGDKNVNDDDGLARLDAGYEVDLSHHVGLLRSGKTAFACSEGRYAVLHEVDGQVIYMTQSELREVLAGRRDPWLGDAE